MSTGEVIKRPRGRPRKHPQVVPKDQNETLDKAKQDEADADQNQTSEEQDNRSIDLGSEFKRWEMLREQDNIQSDEVFTKQLLDLWQKRQSSILVGAATFKDFDAYKTKRKKSADEVIRFFLRRDVEPGQHVVILSDEVGTAFESLRTGLKVRADRAVKHLLIVRDKYMRTKSGFEAEKGVQVPSPVEQAEVKDLVKSESHPESLTKIKLETDTCVKATGTEMAGPMESPDSGKKRPRKSHPQRVVVESDTGNVESDSEMEMPDEADIPDGGERDGSLPPVNPPISEPTSDRPLQYNYVLNNETAFDTVPKYMPIQDFPLIGTPQVYSQDVAKTFQRQLQGSVGLVQAKLKEKLTSGTREKTPMSKRKRGPGKEASMYDVDDAGYLKCPYCNFKCQGYRIMRAHHKIHLGEGYRCKFCGRCFNYAKGLVTHMKSQHQVLSFNRCKLCVKVFNTLDALNFHEKMHKRNHKFWCDTCSEGFHSVQNFENHASTHTDLFQMKCHLCYKEFHNLQPFIIHRKYCFETLAGLMYKCELCMALFKSSDEMYEHYSEAHADLAAFKCACDEEFLSVKFYEEHIKLCTTAIEAKANGFEAEVEGDGLNDIEIVSVESLNPDAEVMDTSDGTQTKQNGQQSCTATTQTGPSTSRTGENDLTPVVSLERVDQTTASANGEVGGADGNKVSSAVPNSIPSVTWTRKRGHEGNPIQRKPSVVKEILVSPKAVNEGSEYKTVDTNIVKSEPPGRNKSDVVEIDEDSSDSIQIVNVESGEKITCDLSGDNKSSITLFVNEHGFVTPYQGVGGGADMGDDKNGIVKTENKNFISRGSVNGVYRCEHCPYTVRRKSQIIRHMLEHDLDRYDCIICPQSFKSKAKFEDHMNAKHLYPGQYKCDKCSRTFLSKGGITYHQQTKHSNSYKYKCETCDRGFNTMQHYLGHKNTHNGVRPFVCDRCNLGFSYPSVLTSHKRVCKGKIDGSCLLDFFPCKLCEKKCSSPETLQQHIRISHAKSITKRYMCECGETFELKALFDHHKLQCKSTDQTTALIVQAAVASVTSPPPQKFTADPFNQPVFPS